ncbi:hypothetical protein DD630_19530 [Streptomyces sp. BSE7F]|nr:hypothetical protein DD630_19530 [Streptomyces sp. BSE7F]
MLAQFPAPLRGAFTAAPPGARGTARPAPHRPADESQGRGELRDRPPPRRRQHRASPPKGRGELRAKPSPRRGRR